MPPADRPQEPESLADAINELHFDRGGYCNCCGGGFPCLTRRLVNDHADLLAATCQERDTLRRQLADARAAIRDIDDHATPLGTDEDGFVTTGYLVSVGAMHRALGVAQGAAAVLREVPANPGVSGLFRGMVVCETCGNKRCPHAADTALACTGSNEPGQPGSNYPAHDGLPGGTDG